MKFKAKLKKHGNGMSIYIPKEVYTKLAINTEYEWEVYTGKEEVKVIPIIGTIDSKTEKISYNEKLPGGMYVKEEKPFNTEMCSKHEGSMKGTCGCS